MWSSFKIAVPLLVVAAAVFLLTRPICACNTREKAYGAAMKSDLRNLVTAQEIRLLDSLPYSADLDSLRFVASTGVTMRVIEATDSGWAAQSTHRGARGLCAVWVGRVRDLPLAKARTPAAEGEPYCTEIRRRGP